MDKTNSYVFTDAIGSYNNRVGLSLVAGMVVFSFVSRNRNRVTGFSRKKAPGINGRTEQIRKRSKRKALG
ncbi:MAG: hypothetical protein OEM04_11710 [Flavobacteriaceae bacterium]|nr:hypothetical protein [Flavobacteriaceae bacterium]